MNVHGSAARRGVFRFLGAAAGVFMLAGVAAVPSAQAEPGAAVDDVVRTTLQEQGVADVIIRLHEQADLSDVGIASVVASSTLGEVRDLLGGITGSVRDIVGELEGAARVAAVVETLQATVDGSAGDVATLLREREAAGHVRDVDDYWIFNGFSATIDQDTLDALATHPDVASVTQDEVIELADTAVTTADAAPVAGVAQLASFGLLSDQGTQAWGVERVRAPEVWRRHGTRGEGVVVGILDSGVDGRHPELAATWRGRNGDLAKSWYVPTGEAYRTPGDRRGHGTHVAGTLVSESFGVAPGAEWIAAKVFRDNGTTTVSAIHAGMQWMLAPGGDPSAAPDVVNSSWGTSSRHTTEFWQDLEAWEAAGIVPVFAVGNRGPHGESLSSPASFPHVIAVGATDGSNQVARFSSRGPVRWDGASYVKPDLVAPGVRIRSTAPGSGNRMMTGSSMATPHVAGTVALMRSVNPRLSVAEVRDALERTSRRGDAVANNNFGHGLVDALAAVNAASR